VIDPERLVGLEAQRPLVLTAAGLGDDGDDARLGVAELGRARPGGDRGLLEAAGADIDRAAERADEGVAPVAGLDGNPINVRGGLVFAAATDGEIPGVVHGDARLKRENVIDPVDREVVRHGAVDALLGGDLVAGDQRLGLAHDGDLLDLHRRLLQLDVHRAGLPAEHLHAVHLGGLVADEGRSHRDGARRDVVDEVVALGVRQGVERRPHDEHLSIGDGRAGLIAHPAFDLTGRALGQQRAGSERQPDRRERDSSRCACEGADTALLHEVFLQRREPAGARTACRWDRLSRREAPGGTCPS
jgi:hypothetical protein